jgi:hypothetical protein
MTESELDKSMEDGDTALAEATKDFEYTSLIKINPKQSTLPIDTASEWTKAFILINTVVVELMKDTFIEMYTDETGKRRRLTHLHPQLLPFMQERRKLQDQIWKISGGEAINEGKKELYKKQADLIFEMAQDKSFKDKHEEEVQKVIEAEFDDKS